ncbi:hypothetical protein N0V88_004935 [Collariella sp. IMI 366227]|nr:hypothetical protein N0V88_004935 [Collariella sp. IMI 366227]
MADAALTVADVTAAPLEEQKTLPTLLETSACASVDDCLETRIWAPILANLQSFTITRGVLCCDFKERNHIGLSDTSADKELDRHRAKAIKHALKFYGDHLPASVEAHHRVWCDRHTCGCRLEDKGCAKVHKYIKDLWLKEL